MLARLEHLRLMIDRQRILAVPGREQILDRTYGFRGGGRQ